MQEAAFACQGTGGKTQQESKQLRSVREPTRNTRVSAIETRRIRLKAGPSHSSVPTLVFCVVTLEDLVGAHRHFGEHVASIFKVNMKPFTPNKRKYNT
jgi:hypothetical protein